MWRFRLSCLGRRNSASALLAPRNQLSRDKRSFVSIRTRMFRSSAVGLALLSVIAPAYANPTTIPAPTLNTRVIISVRDQKLMLMENGVIAATYPVSTSKYGLGDRWGSLATPLGLLQVAQKIGDHAPIGAVFHNRRWKIGRASCRERVEVSGVGR